MNSRKELEANDEKTINLAMGTMYTCINESENIVIERVIPIKIAGIILFLIRVSPLLCLFCIE